MSGEDPITFRFVGIHGALPLEHKSVPKFGLLFSALFHLDFASKVQGAKEKISSEKGPVLGSIFLIIFLHFLTDLFLHLSKPLVVALGKTFRCPYQMLQRVPYSTFGTPVLSLLTLSHGNRSFLRLDVPINTSKT